MRDVDAVQGCQWPLYLAGNQLTQYTALLPNDSQTPLIVGLRDSDYVESTAGPALKFELSLEDPENYRMAGRTTIQQLFLGDVWITIIETGKSDYAESAVSTLLSLNPHLEAQSTQ